MFRIATQYVNYYVVLFNPVTIAGISASAPTSWAHTWVSFPHLSWLYSQSMGSSFQSCKLLSSRGWQDARRSDLLLLRCALHRSEYPKTLHSWCSGRLVLASPVSTMVEPLLLNHALGGAQKTESSKLHNACIGTWFVPGRNIQPVHVQRSQLPSHITCIGLHHRWRFASFPSYRAS